MKQDHKIHRLVKEIADMAEHASLTGSLDSGKPAMIQRYNSLLDSLEDESDVPHGLFGKLPESADFGQIGVEARLLYAYLKDSGNDNNGGKHGDLGVVVRLAPFVKSADLTEMVRACLAEGCSIDTRTLTHLAPFLEQGILSDLVRHHIGKAAGVVVVDARKAERSSPGTPPTPGTPPAPPETVSRAEAVQGDQDLIDLVTDELLRDDLTPERRRTLIDQLKGLTKRAQSLPD